MGQGEDLATRSRKRIVEEYVNYSNGNSFNNGNSMDLGSGDGNGQARDGSRPASAAWMFTVLVWRI